ncbi:MAG: hypothetical protein OEZ02_13450 [Anaerolineae bacterium]|nr:hypothetical protein [Anaerolineae bacterium]
MLKGFSRILDVFSDFLSKRKGLLPSLGIMLILSNLIIQFLPGFGIIAETNLLLHLGIVVAIFGFMLAWAL